jgi:hypothetical protein
MAYQIVTAPEVENWLAEVRERDPGTAQGIDAAVATLQAGGASIGPPLVVPADWPHGQGGAAFGTGGGGLGIRTRRRQRASSALRCLPPRAISRLALAGLAAVYRRQQAEQARMFRAAADAATSGKRLELRIGQLEKETGDSRDQRLIDAARRERAAVQSRQKRVVTASKRLHADLAAFEAAWEAIRVASIRVEEAVELARAHLNSQPDSQGRRSVRRNRGHADSAPPALQPLRLQELRPETHESAEIRILFVVEPPGTAMLLAAGSESDWLGCWYAQVAPLCWNRYRREQEKRAPRRARDRYQSTAGSDAAESNHGGRSPS